MKGLRSALAFLTILPVGSSPVGRPRARAWFPAAGLLIGAMAAGVGLLIGWVASGAWAGPPDPSVTLNFLAGAATVAALAILSGALHLDGFMDTCDALLGGSDRDQRRRILGDPHVGSFAVVGVTCLLLVKVASVSALPWDTRVLMVVLAPCLARGAMLLTMKPFPYVGQGLGAEFLSRTGRGQLAFGLGFSAIAAVALGGPFGLALMALACLVAWLIGAWATRLLGGVTGDIYGAVVETAEMAVLLTAALLAARWPTLWGW